MKKVLLTLTIMSLVVSSAFAANFAPEVMKLSAPPTIQYDFDGSDLAIPVTVTGVGGTGAFLVFTKDQAASISKVTNGFLGWHYVNKIDTCLFVSPFRELPRGTTNLTWDGKDQDGGVAPEADYTYYVWAVDNVNPRVQMTQHVTLAPWGFRTIVTHDTDGSALANPILYKGSHTRTNLSDGVPVLNTHTHQKWVIGGDPQDATLRETTQSTGYVAVGGLAFQPDDYKYYFFDTLRDAGPKITQKWEWVPNGMSVPVTTWGEDGQFSYTGQWTGGWNFGPGVVSDGKDYLFVVNADISGQGTESQLIYLDVNEGVELQRLDLSDWWTIMSDADAGGQATGGPTEVYLRNDLMFFGAHGSCLNQMIDPYYDDEEEAVLWTNGNGDYTGDHNFEPDAQLPWVCNDYNVGPFKYNISADANLFSVFPSYDMGAVSFGLYAPDGTGMGYVALAGETARQKYGVEFIDYGSAFDGLYTTNNTGESGVDASIWHVGHDSISGVISKEGIVGVADGAPAIFAVSQNVPNPFNPTTTINFSLSRSGQTSVDVYNVAGQKVDTIVNSHLNAGSHSVTWNAANFSAGVYFYTVRSGDFSRTMKMTLLK